MCRDQTTKNVSWSRACRQTDGHMQIAAGQKQVPLLSNPPPRPNHIENTNQNIRHQGRHGCTHLNMTE